MKDGARSMLGTRLAPFALAASLVLAMGCQTTAPASESELIAPVWPQEPATARIRWVSEVRGPADLGIRPGFFRRLWDWVSGNEAPRMVRPHGLAMDSEGRLWVADPGARRVHVFDIPGNRYRVIPSRDQVPFQSPIAIAHDDQGVAYVSDSALGVIRRFDAEGRDLGSWDGQGALGRPTGLAFDQRSGLLWVADTGNHRLLAFDRRGRIQRFVGERGSGPGRFNFPTHLALGTDGRIFVTDSLNFRVQILTPEGQFVAAFGHAGDGPGQLSKPKGIALDRDGHVYVVDSLFDNVQIFDQQGQILLHFGDRGAGPGQFWLPAGLCIADGGRIYVADGFNQRIQVFEYLGE